MFSSRVHASVWERRVFLHFNCARRMRALPSLLVQKNRIG